VTVTPALRQSAATAAVEGLRSAVYEGTVRHRRDGPGVTHEFSYPVSMLLLNLREIDEVVGLQPLFSSRYPAPVWFRRTDFLGDRAAPLDDAVRDLVEERSGRRPTGPVALLANMRTWGWLFNPISLYFCFEEGGTAVETLVAEVENTPWHERHRYVVGPPGRHRFAKLMHVSPFMPMELDYELRYSAPGERLSVQLDAMRGGERLLGANLSLRRRALDRRALGRLLWSYPAHKVSAGIYAQAARLRFKGARYYKHPSPCFSGGFQRESSP